MNRLMKASSLFVVSALFAFACGSAPESSSKRLDPNATSTTSLSKSPFARWVLDGWCAYDGGAVSELLGKAITVGGEPAEWYSEALNRTNPDERVALAGSRGDLERAKDEMDRQNLHYEPFEMDGVRGLAVPAPSCDGSQNAHSSANRTGRPFRAALRCSSMNVSACLRVVPSDSRPITR